MRGGIAGLALAAALLSATAVTASAAGSATTINSHPPAQTNQTTATFTFSTTGPGPMDCQVTGRAVVHGCTSPHTVQNLPEGQHTFSVTDTGVSGDTPSTYTWTVDLTPPSTSVTGQPAALSNSRTSTFTFSSPDASATFQCSLNGAAVQPCTSPVTYSGLSDATRSLLIQAVDPAGNVDTNAKAITWTVDATPPDTTLANPGDIRASTDPTFSFTSSEASSTFQCSLGTVAFTSCASGQVFLVPKSGDHKFRVRAVDGAGNVDPTPAVYTWTSDVTPPQRPKVYIFADPGASTSSVTLSPAPMPGGGVTLANPLGHLVLRTPAFTLASRLRAQWSSDATAVSYDVTETITTEGVQPGPQSLVTQQTKQKRTALVLHPGTGNTVCVSVAARDKLGNLSSTRSACTTIPYSFAPPWNSGPIKRVRAARAWHGFYVVIKGPTGIYWPVDQLGYGEPSRATLVAERCSSCGVIEVAWASQTGLQRVPPKLTKLSLVALTGAGGTGKFGLIDIKLHASRLRALGPGYLVIIGRSGRPHIAGFGLAL